MIQDGGLLRIAYTLGLLLAWLSALVLPVALWGTRVREPHERWLVVAAFCSLCGLGFAALALLGARGMGLGPEYEGASLGALEAGLALLIGLHRWLWQPRGDLSQEGRRLLALSPAGLCFTLAATWGSLEALSWSELSDIQNRWEAWRQQSALVVPPGVAFAVTYGGLWCVVAALWPFRRPAREPSAAPADPPPSDPGSPAPLG